MQKSTKQKALCFLLLFSLAFAGIGLGTYFLFLKNGKSFIWNYDGIKQHYTALCYLGNYYRECISSVLKGDFTFPMFDFSLGMGEDIITTLNFYGLGDPLTLLAVFVTPQKTEYLYDFLVIFRIYLAGLSFAWFCRQKKRSWSCTMIGALIYAFSGYVLHVAVKHPFFVIPMIFLPLAVIGVDRALENKKLTLLIVVVFLTALNGFYFFYMNTVFLVIYALVRILCQNDHRGSLRKTRGKEVLAAVGRCIVSYVIGMAMAGVLFVPSVVAYLTGSRSDSAVNPGNLLVFDAERYQAIFTRLIGTPRITWDYLGMVSLVLPALVVLFMQPWKKQKTLKILIIVWTVLMLMPFGGYMLNGFSYVSGRFTYLVTFVYVVGVVYALPQLSHLSGKKFAVCLAVSVVYFVAVLCSSDANQWYTWFGFMMLCLTMAPLAWQFIVQALGKNAKRLKPRQFYVAIAFLAAVNIIGNGWLLFGGKGQGYVQSFVDAGAAYQTIQSMEFESSMELVPSSMEGKTSSTEVNSSSVEVNSSSIFSRTDNSEKATENDGMLTGVYGVSSYYSISNPNRIEYLLEMEDGGVLDSMFKIDGLDDRTYLEALASVRYYAVEKGKEYRLPYGYEFLKEYQKGGKTYCLYQNKYFLPFGITYENYMTEETWNQTETNALQKQETMLKTVVLEGTEDSLPDALSGIGQQTSLPETEDKEESFEILKTKNITIRNGKAVVGKKGGTLTLRLNTVASDSELYVRLKDFDITQKNRTYCDITARYGKNKKTIRALTSAWNWYFGRDTYLFNLGLTNEETTVCTIRFTCRGTFELENLKVYTQGMKSYEATVSERTADTLQNVSIGKNSVSGNLTLAQSRILFFPVPYSSGWKAFVNGTEVPIYRANTAYMAIALSSGENEVWLCYETPYIRYGIALSVGGVILFVWYLLRERRRKGERQ